MVILLLSLLQRSQVNNQGRKDLVSDTLEKGEVKVGMISVILSCINEFNYYYSNNVNTDHNYVSHVYQEGGVI